MTCTPDLVYDVGMHKGEDAEFYLRKGYRVVAFEANPDLAALCRDRFRADIAAGRLHIIEGAIAPASSGRDVTFYVNNKVSVWGTINQDWMERNDAIDAESREIHVGRVDADEALREFGIPFFVKIDIQGADNLLLDALSRCAGRPNSISMKANTTNIAAIEKEIETLGRLGYRKFQAVQQATIPGSRLRAKTLSGEAFEHIFSEDASAASAMICQGPGCRRQRSWHPTGPSLSERRSSVPGRPLRPCRGGRLLLRGLGRPYRGPLVGWHDTHASL
jgi:FkbM family methyltransferase